MLAIKDLSGEVYPLTGASNIKKVRRVNGEKELSLTLEKTRQNAHFFDDIEKLWRVIDFNGEEYPILLYDDIAEGEGYVREFSCLHSFFDDMRQHVIYTLFSGSRTFADMMLLIFKDSGYTFNIIDTFYAQEFENFGDDYGLELFKTALDRYKAEFSVDRKEVTLRTKVGNTTDFQYRHKFNLESISRSVDALDFSTYGEGYGKDGLKVTYTSPLAEVYGKRPMKAYRNENFSIAENFTQRIKEMVDSTLKIALTVKLSDLRASGYNKNHPNEGDTIILVDDRFDLKVDARIVEITELFHPDGTVIDCDVMLSNYSNIFEQQRRIHNATKTIADAVEGKRPLPYEALAIAVRQATEALQSAQTQLFFENGITGIDPNNPNLMTRFTSRGIGISSDAGIKFPNAITGNGIVATYITSGEINANNVSIGNDRMRLDHTGFGVYSGTTLTAKLTGGFLNFYDFATGESVGRFQSSFLGGSPDVKGISLNLDNNKYISFGYYRDAEFGYERLMSINADVYSRNAGKFGVNLLADGHLNGRTLYFDDISNTTGIRTALTNDAQGTERRVMALLGNNGVFMMDVDGAMGSGSETYSKRIGFFEDNNYLFGPTGETGNTRNYTDLWMGNRSLRFGTDQFHNQSAIYNSSNNDLVIASYGGVGLSHIGTGGTVQTRLTVDENSVDIWQDLDMHGWKIINSPTIIDILGRLSALESK